LPHALVLEARDGSLSVLLPAGAAPRPALDRVVAVSEAGGDDSKKGRSAKDIAVVAAEEAAAVGTKGFGTDTVLDRWDHAWIKNAAAAGGGGHYVYPVHSSHAVLEATSLPAALYLCLLRFLARRYADVVKLADLCVCESKPSAEEAQLWSAFVGVAYDPAPDATAARLRLSVAAFGTPAETLLPWDVEPELVTYVSTWAYISAACRLPANEERELLDSCSPETLTSPLLANRASYLYLRSRVDEDFAVGHPNASAAIQATTRKQTGASSSACPLVYPETPTQGTFDLVDDRSCLEDGVTGDGPLGKLAGLTHSFTQYDAKVSIAFHGPNPASLFAFTRLTLSFVYRKDVTGVAGLTKIGEWLEQSGGNFFALDSSSGFPTLFELLTGSTPLRVLPTDDPHRWGSALLRFVPTEHASRRGTLMSTLRILASSKRVAEACPKVEERGVGARMAAVFAVDGAIGLLLRRVQPFLRERAGGTGGIPPSFASRWNSKRYVPPDMVSVPECGGVFQTPRDAARWALPKFPDSSRSQRSFPMTSHLPGAASTTATAWGGAHLDKVHVPSLVHAPLAELKLGRFFQGQDTDDAETACVLDIDAERAAKLGVLVKTEPGGLPFQVGDHTSAAPPVAKRTLERLRLDIAGAAESAEKLKLKKAQKNLDTGTLNLDTYDVSQFTDLYLTSLTPKDCAFVAKEAAATLLDGSGKKIVKSPVSTKARAALLTILTALRELSITDAAAATEAAAAATSTANGLSRDPSAARAMLRLGLNRRSGAWAECTFDDLIEGLLCSDGEKILARLTPGVGEDGAAAALHLAAVALLLTSRAALASRAAAAAEDAIAAIDGAVNAVTAAASVSAGVEACEFGVSLAAKALADLLRTKRHYFDTSEQSLHDFSNNTGNGPSTLYDPRMLVFEYSQSIVLRKRQVALVRDFTSALRNPNGAECAQVRPCAFPKSRHTVLSLSR